MATRRRLEALGAATQCDRLLLGLMRLCGFSTLSVRPRRRVVGHVGRALGTDERHCEQVPPSRLVHMYCLSARAIAATSPGSVSALLFAWIRSCWQSRC